MALRAARDAAPESAPAPAPAAESEQRPQTDLWNEPVPLLKDRDGHLHLLL